MVHHLENPNTPGNLTGIKMWHPIGSFHMDQFKLYYRDIITLMFTSENCYFGHRWVQYIQAN